MAVSALALASCTDSEGPNAPPPAPPAAVAAVTLSSPQPEVAVQGQMQLDAILTDAGGNQLVEREIRWSSSDPTLASVDDAGMLLGLQFGLVTITASAEGVSGTAEIGVRGVLVGPSGGTVVSDDGFAVANIPAGALTESVAITVSPASASDLPSGSGSDGLVPGSAYDFGPDGQQFSEPVVLTIHYDASVVPAHVAESSLRVRRSTSGAWSDVPNASVDWLADEVMGQVTSFSSYGAVGTPRDLRPTATITAPAGGSSFASGATVTFTGTGTDPDDGALSGGSLVWTSDLDGQFGTSGSVMTSALSIGVHTITLTVTDSNSGVDTDQITVTITNNLPTAAITAPAGGSSFASGATVTFTGTGTDPDDGALSGGSLVWTSDLDGQFGTSGSVMTNGLSIGVHTITLTVTDSNSGVDTDQITVTITNNLPTATITAPAGGSIFTPGATVTFTGTGTDPDDGALSGGSLVWTSDLDGQFGTSGSVMTNGLSIGIHTITLTVTDSNGGVDTDQITVTIT